MSSNYMLTNFEVGCLYRLKLNDNRTRCSLETIDDSTEIVLDGTLLFCVDVAVKKYVTHNFAVCLCLNSGQEPVEVLIYDVKGNVEFFEKVI